MYSWTVQTSRGAGRSSGAILKIVERHYRAESPSVINGIAAADHSRVKETASTRHDEVTQVKSLAEMPGPEGLCALPYIGPMFLFHPFTKFMPEQSNFMFEELHRKYGRIVKFRKGGRWSVLLFDPDLIEEAMNHEGKCPVRPSPPLVDAYSARTGKVRGISQVHGEEWLKMRRPVQEFLLQPSHINQYTPMLDEVANDLVSTISQKREENGHITLDSVMLRYAIESSAVYCISARLGFLQDGPDEASRDHTDCYHHQVHHHHHHHHQHNHHETGCPYASNDNSSLSSSSLSSSSPSTSAPFRQLTEDERVHLMESIKVYMTSVGNGYYTFPFYKLFRTKLYTDFEKAANYLSSVIHSRVSELTRSLYVKSPDSSGANGRPNLLQFLLSDGRLDVNVCTSMLTGFFSTATDNLSNSLGIVLWYLAKNPSKQSKLIEEINRSVQSSRHVSATTLSYMPYLKSCLKESHRLTFPTPFGSVRVMPEDIVLGGYHIPAGTSVNFGHNVLSHSSEYFENPDEFMPERWLKHPHSMTANPRLRRQQSIITMPFGFGLRNCVGRRLAEQQIYLALIKILQNFNLRLGNPDEKLDVVYKITATSAKPLDIRFDKC